MLTSMESVTAFAPATVSNVACGFDVLGFALETPGDEVTARRAAGGVRIADITGDAGRLQVADLVDVEVLISRVRDRLGRRLRDVELVVDVAVDVEPGPRDRVDRVECIHARDRHMPTTSRHVCTAASCSCAARARPISCACPFRTA